MGDADHDGVHDGGMGEEHFLHIAGDDVVATADDDVLGPASDPQKPVGVEIAEVTGQQPTLPPGPLRGFGILEVLPGRPAPPHGALTALPGWYGSATFVDPPDLDTGKRLPDRPEVAAAVSRRR